MATLLELAEQGDIAALTEKLEYACRKIHRYRGRMSESDHLVTEALDYVRAADLDEATLRLRLRACPKFESVADCEIKYNAVMAEKRARASA